MTINAASVTPAIPPAERRYRNVSRPSESAETVNIEQLGHMIHTLNDTLVFMRTITDQPAINVLSADVEMLPMDIDAPAYLTRYAIDPRHQKSMVFNDIKIEQTPYPNLAGLIGNIHGAMRELSLDVGKILDVAPGSELAKAIKNYQEIIARYTALLQQTKGENRKPDYKKISENEAKEYSSLYAEPADRLFAILEDEKLEVPVKIQGVPYTLSNHKLHEELPNSYLALVLAMYGSAGNVGSGISNNNKRPAYDEYRPRLRSVIGARSDLSKVLQGILDEAKEKGTPIEQFDIDREEFKELLKNYVRPLQIALAFCRTAECTYDTAYKDMELFLRMAGADVNPGELQDPQEAALILYAIDRRFGRDGVEVELQECLREYADKINGMYKSSEQMREDGSIGPYKSFARMKDDLSRDPDFQQLLEDARQAALEHRMDVVAEMLDKIKGIAPPLLNAASRAQASQAAFVRQLAV